MKKLCLNKLIFETKEVIFPEFLSIFSLTKFEEHYYIFLSSFETPEYADKDFEISKNLAEGIWCLDNTGKVLWKIKPLISISSVPKNKLHSGYFVQFTHFEINKESRQLIAYGINNAKAFINISTGETLKQTQGFRG